ncbi:TRAP transporter substrate-binding protein DctP [Enterovibrio sp. ZSDZ42]|uniref:TRAP transporter substrate-binding protein DctP n=1 Tax=Enterovibrio gelatinilyticus TaxID=2899819 RepID=A0ABT5QZ24_9GAMM|nr:TRAP transporter substrate-binding protein DctP [Enterovibrio sp. ZSDZ42]MDD1792791.1 TRAP transporter substrate-binding protein DctP [Enterovibrio sp. ZSDZ42]
MMRMLMLGMAVLLLTSCERNAQSNTKTAVKAETITLTLALSSASGKAELQTAEHFADLVDTTTQGEISVRVITPPSSTFDREIIAQVQQGELDIAITPSSKLSHLTPKMQILDLPYLFKDEAAARRVYNSNAGRTLLSDLKDHDLEGLALWPGGLKQLITNFPLLRFEDFNNKRFDTMESRVIREQFDAWGANTIAIAANQTADAFTQKAIDGTENTYANIAKLGIEDLHVIETNHGFLTFVMMMSSRKLKSLPSPLKTALMEAVKASALHHQILVNTARQEAIRVVKTQQAVIPVSPALLHDMEKSFKSLLELNRMAFGTVLVEQVLQAREDWKQTHSDTLIVALDADLQGSAALSGLAIRRGIELALDEINEQGGLLGKPVKLIARDNSMVPSRGVDNIKTFATQPNLLAIFGGISSPVMLAELDFIHENNMLMLAPWAAATPIVDSGRQPNFVFRVSVRDEYAAEFLLKGALNVSNNIGLLLVNNGWGRSNYKGLTEAMKKRSIEPASLEWFDWGEKEFADKTQRLVDQGAEVIIYVGNAVEGEKFLSVLSTLPDPPVVVSHWGITGSEFAKNAANALEKVDLRVLQTISFIDNDSPAVSSLASKYQRKYSTSSTKDIFAPSGTAHAYDLMNLLAQATRQANENSMVRIRQEMKKIRKHKGVMKEYLHPFKQQHDALTADDYIFTHYHNGKLHPLEQIRK